MQIRYHSRFFSKLILALAFFVFGIFAISCCGQQEPSLTPETIMEMAKKQAAEKVAAGDWEGAQQILERARKMADSLGEMSAETTKCRKTLEVARMAKKRGAWEEVVAATDELLAVAPRNEEAQMLNAEAKKHLRPSIRLKTTLDGLEVAATVTKGLKESGRTTPLTVNLQNGGSYNFAVVYEVDGKQYAGQTTVQAKSRGTTEVTLPLVKVKGTVQGGKVKTIALPGGATMEMVWCPPGTFVMGSPESEWGRGRDETQHQVTLTKGFWMSKTEVTQKQWQSVMGNNPSYYKGENLPVEKVKWKDCQNFCQNAGNGLRLPTEAEWEYACRAGSEGAYAGTGQLEDMGWYGVLRGSPHPVGLKEANAWGLYDMHGNVLEWCEDWIAAYPSHAVTDPTGPRFGDYHVMRGGSYWRDAANCRSARRLLGGVRDYEEDIGFRPVTSQE